MRREEHRPSHLSQGAFALLLKACFFHMWTALLRTHLPPLFTNRLIASPHTLNPDAGNPYHSGHLLTRRTHPSGACSLSRTGPVIPPLGLNDNTDNTFVYLWGCACVFAGVYLCMGVQRSEGDIFLCQLPECSLDSRLSLILEFSILGLGW